MRSLPIGRSIVKAEAVTPNYTVKEYCYTQENVDRAYKQGIVEGRTEGILYGMLFIVLVITIGIVFQL